MNTEMQSDGVFDIDTFGNLVILGFVVAIFGMAFHSICQMG